MSYSQQFIQSCSNHPAIGQLVQQKMLSIDEENMLMKFNLGDEGLFKINDLNFDDDSDMPMVVTYAKNTTFTFMLDDAAGYHGKNIDESVERFANLVTSLAMPSANIKRIYIATLSKWSVITIETGTQKFTSAPFTGASNFAQIPGAIVQLLGAKKELPIHA